MKKIYFLVLMLFINNLYAEGTYELNNKSSTNANIYLESPPAGINTGVVEAGLKRITLINVDILNEDEKIDFYTSGYKANTDVAIWCESNLPNSFENDHYYAQKRYNVSQGGIGYIGSWNDVVNVQNINTRPRSPITFDPKVDGCGIGTYYIRFYGTGNSQANDAIAYFDVRVKSETIIRENKTNLRGSRKRYCEYVNYDDPICYNETINQSLKSGRVWSYHYSLIMNGFEKQMYSKYYIVAGKNVLDYYYGHLWEVKNQGLQPYGFHVTANSLGSFPQKYNNKSVSISNNPIMIPEYPIYLNPPEKKIIVPSSPPAVNNINFDANCSSSNTPQGGSFSFNATSEWNYAFYIDENKDGLFLESEAIIRGRTVDGNNLISWDGKFENGEIVPKDVNLLLNLNIADGEIHFPYYDVENTYSVNGPIINLYNQNITDRSKMYFWDDTDIGGDASNYLGSLIPHQWGGTNLGNDAIVDTWKNALNNTYNLNFEYGSSCKALGNLNVTLFNDVNHDSLKNDNEFYNNLDYSNISLINLDNQTCEVINFDANGKISKDLDFGNYKVVLGDDGNGNCSTSALNKINNIITTDGFYDIEIKSINSNIFFGVFKGKTISGLIVNDNGLMPHNGIKENDEYGISNLNVFAKDNISSLIIETTKTENGKFKLWIPINFNDINIYYNQSNDYISVNSNSGSVVAYEITNDNIKFLMNQNNITEITGLVFSDVLYSYFEESNLYYAKDGSSFLISNKITSNTETNNLFNINNKNLNWTIVFYDDLNCNNVIDINENIIYENITNLNMIKNESRCIISKIFIPLGTEEGTEISYDLCLNIGFTNSSKFQDICLVNKLRVISNNANIQIIKTTDKYVAKPGENISYTIELINNGLENAQNVVVYDATPPYTSFISADCENKINSNILSCVYNTNLNNGEGDIQWDLNGHLAPNESYKLFYNVKINE